MRKDRTALLGMFSFFLLAQVPASAQTANFIEQWNAATSVKFTLSSPNGSTTASNVTDASAADGKVLQLTIPANSVAGAGRGPEVETKTTYKYGTFSARLKSVDIGSQSDAGTVTGLFTYFNNGTDQTGDGLPDNSEIDFEWLGAEPQSVYLTMWTDYRASDERSKRVTRKINLRTGTIEHCFYAESFGGTQTNLTGQENQPTTVQAIAGYCSATAYYEYGFTWTASRVTWWMVLPDSNKKIILWDYQGPATRIPARPSYFMINAWHTNNWPPETRPAAIKPPTSAVSAFVDWARFDTIGTSAVRYFPVRARETAFPKPSPSAVFDCLGRQAGRQDFWGSRFSGQTAASIFLTRSGVFLNTGLNH